MFRLETFSLRGDCLKITIKMQNLKITLLRKLPFYKMPSRRVGKVKMIFFFKLKVRDDEILNNVQWALEWLCSAYSSCFSLQTSNPWPCRLSCGKLVVHFYHIFNNVAEIVRSCNQRSVVGNDTALKASPRKNEMRLVRLFPYNTELNLVPELPILCRFFGLKILPQWKRKIDWKQWLK